jgi:hypothetical protein
MLQAMCECKEVHVAQGDEKEVAVPYRLCSVDTEGAQRVDAFKYPSV